MYTTLVAIIISLVLSLLIVNVYFRVKVMRCYKSLLRAKVEFDLSHILSPRKLEEEILPKYPESTTDIRTFVHHLKVSFRIGMVLFVLISLFGWVLMRYR